MKSKRLTIAMRNLNQLAQNPSDADLGKRAFVTSVSQTRNPFGCCAGRNVINPRTTDALPAAPQVRATQLVIASK